MALTKHTRDNRYVFIGAAATKTTGAKDAMNTGEIAIYTVDGRLMTEALAATETEFVVVQQRGTGASPDVPQLQSPIMNKNDMQYIRRLVHTAATEQSEFWGYNGTTGSIQAIDSNEYFASIEMLEYLTSSTNGATRIPVHFVAASDASTNTANGQSAISIGLAGNGVANMSKQPEAYIRFRALVNTAASAVQDFDNTATVTNGSKVMSVATSLAFGAAGVPGTAVAGDYIRIADTDVAVALTDDVYRIESISGQDITLDRPYQGTTGTRTTAAAGSTQVILEATGDADNWGVSLTGQALTFVLGKKQYKKVRWTTSLKRFGTTTTPAITAAAEGSGNVEQVQEDEYFSQGQQGEAFRMGEPYLFPRRADTDTTLTGYDCITFQTKSSKSGSFQPVDSRNQIIIYTPETTPNYCLAATADDLTDVLEVLFSGAVSGDLALT